MISIHAPTWGATRFGKLVAGTDYISIHAPTWGATGDHFYPKNNKLFQSTLPRGERPPCLSPYGGVMVFQSTLPRGERHNATVTGLDANVISIHAPTWGATRLLSEIRNSHSISIHAPTWGATATISYFSLIYNLHLCNMHNLKQLSNNSTYEFHHLVKHFLVRTSLAIHVCFLLAPS